MKGCFFRTRLFRLYLKFLRKIQGYCQGIASNCTICIQSEGDSESEKVKILFSCESEFESEEEEEYDETSKSELNCTYTLVRSI